MQAAGAIGAALFGWPSLVGTLCLGVAIAGFVTFGNTSVERLFKWVSIFLYATYGLFVVLAEQEKKIRTDPAAQVTDLLKKVFGK